MPKDFEPTSGIGASSKRREDVRFLTGAGRYTDDINGAQERIAGITNKAGNVLGLMPHPERHADAALGGTDGAVMFRAVAATLAA